jgi:ferric-dicitrate binding protein FerR (iron transport regulator)
MSDNHDEHWENIAGKLHGELSSEEEAEFIQLIADNTRLQEFEKAQIIHDNLSKVGVIPLEGKVESWVKVEHGIKIHQLQWIKTALKYAAIIVLAFIAGNLLRPSLPSDKEIRYSEITVPFGQMSQIKLSDGTKIWLNSGTTLRYPEQFAEKSRSVSIVGEAYFEVAKMAHKPFNVNTTELNIEVLGTSFNLSAYKDDAATLVTLVEGKVAVHDNTGKTIAQLIPGQMAVKNKQSNTLDISNVETSFYAAWIAGKIYFDDEPLDQIAVKLERWFNVEITFADEKLKSHKFTGTILKNKPVDQIMQALELLSPIRFKHQVNAIGKDKITIYKRS